LMLVPKLQLGNERARGLVAQERAE